MVSRKAWTSLSSVVCVVERESGGGIDAGCTEGLCEPGMVHKDLVGTGLLISNNRKLGVVEHTLVIPVLGKLRQEDQELKVILGYLVSSRPACTR